MTRTEVLERASRPQVGDRYQSPGMDITITAVSIHFVTLETGEAPLQIPFHKWPTIITATLSTGAAYSFAASPI